MSHHEARFGSIAAPGVEHTGIGFLQVQEIQNEGNRRRQGSGK